MLTLFKIFNGGTILYLLLMANLCFYTCNSSHQSLLMLGRQEGEEFIIPIGFIVIGSLISRRPLSFIFEIEILAVVKAAHRWAYSWANHTVYVFSDNFTTVACINKGSSRNALLMHYIRQLFWLSAIYNFRLIAKHIPGKNNVLADAVSRLHFAASSHMCLIGC